MSKYLIFFTICLGLAAWAFNKGGDGTPTGDYVQALKIVHCQHDCRDRYPRQSYNDSSPWDETPLGRCHWQCQE